MDLPAFLAEDRGPSIIATASTMIFLSTLFVGMRYYARYLTGTSFGVQDIIIPFAWLAEVGVCINGISKSHAFSDLAKLLTVTVMVKLAYTGRHMAYVVTVDASKINTHFKGILYSEFLHLAAVALPKLLVILLYLHILTNKYERIAAKVLIALTFATWLSYTIAAMFQCTPFAFNWDKTVANGRCFNVELFANSSSVPNIFTDLAVLVLPLRTVWGLKISVGRRVGLLIIFLTGSVCVTSSSLISLHKFS
jgi:hypothetical protein